MKLLFSTRDLEIGGRQIEGFLCDPDDPFQVIVCLP